MSERRQWAEFALTAATIVAVVGAGIKAYIDVQVNNVRTELMHYSDENRHAMFSREDFDSLMRPRDKACESCAHVQMDIITQLLPDIRSSVNELSGEIKALKATQDSHKQSPHHFRGFPMSSGGQDATNR